jgi:hypothetical protein
MRYFIATYLLCASLSIELINNLDSADVHACIQTTSEGSDQKLLITADGSIYQPVANSKYVARVATSTSPFRSFLVVWKSPLCVQLCMAATTWVLSLGPMEKKISLAGRSDPTLQKLQNSSTSK